MKFMKKKDNNIENSNNNNIKEKDKEKDKKEKDKEKEKEIKEIEKKEKKEKKNNNNSKKKNEDIDSNSNNNNSKRVFGGSLPFLFEEELPAILVQTIDYLESNGLETPGIFRENGSLASIQNYRALYDNDKTVNFPPHEAHVVASLLKAYLRELKDPLCTFEHYDMFIACESIADEKVKVELLKKVIAHLPPYNRKVMKYIFSFLLKVVEHSSVNKMAPDALSVVFLPTILRPKANTDLEILQFTVEDSKSTKTLMSSILLNYEEIFEDPSLFQPRTRQTRAHTEFVSPPSSQNSTSSILSSAKNTPRSPIPSPNFSAGSLLSALPPPPLSPLLTPTTVTNMTVPLPPPPPITSSIDDNNQTSLISKPSSSSSSSSSLSLSSTSAPSISTTITTTNTPTIPPPLPDKKLCKLLPNIGEQSTSSSQTSPTLSSTENTTLPPPPPPPTLELPPSSTTTTTTTTDNSLPISPNKNITLPTLPPKPPSLVLPTLPPKPIPKIPNMFEYENNNVRNRSNTTFV